MKITNRLFDRRVAPVVIGVFVVVFVLEARRQLRKRTQPQLKQLVTNALVSVPSFSLLRFVFLPVLVWLAQQSHKNKFGLNHRYNARPFVKTMVAFLAMDYTNYLWHILNHKMPALWRFHLVHHTDLDLNISTALRFHFGELIGSVFYRGAFVFLTGATAVQVLVYEGLFEAATQFHHSNWRLPYRLEKALNALIVTPRMHGIHHSILQHETDSNYAVIFSFWDRLHGTVRLNVAQEAIITGVSAYRDPGELTAIALLKLPFGYIRPLTSASHDVRPANALDKNKLTP